MRPFPTLTHAGPAGSAVAACAAALLLAVGILFSAGSQPDGCLPGEMRDEAGQGSCRPLSDVDTHSLIQAREMQLGRTMKSIPQEDLPLQQPPAVSSVPETPRQDAGASPLSLAGSVVLPSVRWLPNEIMWRKRALDLLSLMRQTHSSHSGIAKIFVLILGVVFFCSIVWFLAMRYRDWLRADAGGYSRGYPPFATSESPPPTSRNFEQKRDFRFESAAALRLDTSRSNRTPSPAPPRMPSPAQTRMFFEGAPMPPGKSAQGSDLSAQASNLSRQPESPLEGVPRSRSTPPRQRDHLPTLDQVRPGRPNSAFRSARAQEQNRSDTLPPLCPTLVLPLYEARFGIAMHLLVDPTTLQLPIIGRTGNTLLQASIQNGSVGRALKISVVHPGQWPHASIRPPPTRSLHEHLLKREFEICGPNGAFYGMFKPGNEGIFHVSRGSQTVLDIEGDVVGLRFTALAPDRQLLASASKNSDNFGGVEHLEFIIQPGVDAVLVLLCILGIILVVPPSEGSIGI